MAFNNQQYQLTNVNTMATPGSIVWMQRPPPLPGCPPGLEYLTQIDTLLVNQIPSLTEALLGFEKNNKYVVKNSAQQQVFFAAEDTDVCMRMFCGPRRGFTIHIIDNFNQEVMRLSREFKCCNGCCWLICCCSYCANEITIEAPVGQVIGYIKEAPYCCKPNFDVLDANRQRILRIERPWCCKDQHCCTCKFDVDYKILGTDGVNEIGKITKHWSGFIREAYTDADNFSVKFPIDLSVCAKASLLGALFLIPGQIVWAHRPHPIPGCPLGLEYLTQIDQLNIKQIPSLTEVLVGFEKNNKYAITNEIGQQIFFAAEDTSACMRFTCGPRRGFNIHVFDNFSQEVLKITREYKCCSGCCWFAGCCDCCSHELTVESPAGNPIGYIRQSSSFFRASFDVLDNNKERILQIDAPFCVWDNCFCDTQFKILGLDSSENQIGLIIKEYSGFVKETFTNADNFKVSFPTNLSVPAKATLLAAVFLIDFMYFEQPKDNHKL